MKVSTKIYTVIGFYPDNGQKFNSPITAGNPDEALLIAEDQNPCLIVCGVVGEAVPDMLDALKYVVRYHRENDSGEGELFGLDYVTTCINAIRKAEGRWE